MKTDELLKTRKEILAFDSRHCAADCHGKSRRIKAEIVTKTPAGHLCNFIDVCPYTCLDLAKTLHEEGHVVSGVYTHYTPFKGCNFYKEASPWFFESGVRGLTQEYVSLRSHCKCESRH